MPLVFDIETNGFLSRLDRIHTLCLMDTETGQRWSFRHNTNENTIREGVELLREAPQIIGHNVLAFDVPALQKIHPDFKPKGEVLDTMVLCRVAAPDIRSSDMQRWKKGLLPGNLIGSHSLDAWGRRLGRHKGDYSAQMRAKGLDPFAEWNEDMEAYCVNDVEVTALLYANVRQVELHPDCVALEHDIHELAGRMERNGFPFDLEAAKRLEGDLRSEYDALNKRIVSLAGMRFAPEGKKQVKPRFYDPEGVQADKERKGLFKKPDPLVGEDLSRSWWGKVTVFKRDHLRDGVQFTAGAPFCRAKWEEMNPGSRSQIVDFLIDRYDWTPTEFTETGAPSVAGPALEKLSEEIPVVKDIAEFYFYQKLLGQLAEGPQAWIKQYDPATGCIHARTDTGGAVTGRCTHSSPNIAQVPAVLTKKYAPAEDFIRHPVFDQNDGWAYEELPILEGKKKPKEFPKLGRDGEFGWECRSLFRVPEGWDEVGTDLSGIEFRCLAELTAPFDDGELIEVVLNGDIHQFNMDKTGIPSRDIVKRVLYGLLYGAGDEKLGLTAKPTASPAEARVLGASLRAQLMAGLPALHEAIKRVQRDARRGYLIGLDGRKIKVRSEHSALNTRLQSDAALIAKRWMILSDQMAKKEGAFHGWKNGDTLGDFVIMAFIHDEQQVATAPDFSKLYAKIAVQAAAQAGLDFGFRCPVGAEAKIGKSWAECH
jgi:DNA polymerase I-like protein with 3'-5' exonuclease and polymerase domains